MGGETNYLLIWFIYLASSAVFFWVLWQFTALLWRWPAWVLRTFMAALILTPVFPRNEDEAAVPALMVVALDTIAAGSTAAAARGLAALAAGMVATVVIATALLLGLSLLRRGNFGALRRHPAINRLQRRIRWQAARSRGGGEIELDNPGKTAP